MLDYVAKYLNCRNFAEYCLDNGDPPIMAMLGYVDNMMELDFLIDELMELGRS